MEHNTNGIYLYEGAPQTLKTTKMHINMQLVAVSKHQKLKCLTVMSLDDNRNKNKDGAINHNGLTVSLQKGHDIIHVGAPDIFSKKMFETYCDYDVIGFEELHITLGTYCKKKDMNDEQAGSIDHIMLNLLRKLAFDNKKIVMVAIIDVWITMKPVNLCALIRPYARITRCEGKCDMCGRLCSTIPRLFRDNDQILDDKIPILSGGNETWGTICAYCDYELHPVDDILDNEDSRCF
jgi:hypothetical protein